MERTEIKLGLGAVEVFDLGGIRLHAYKSANPLKEESFVLEKGDKLVAIESMGFKSSIAELCEYVNALQKGVAGVIGSYHAIASSFFGGARRYSTQEAMAYLKSEQHVAALGGFVAAFGDDFDATISEATDLMSPGSNNIGGIDFVIRPFAEAFDIEIPEINSLYIHMLGADCYSIIPSEAFADAFISNLDGCLKRGYALVLSSHHAPEGLEAVRAKKSHIARVKELARATASAADFKARVIAEFPDYLGENYLDMTARMLKAG